MSDTRWEVRQCGDAGEPTFRIYDNANSDWLRTEGEPEHIWNHWIQAIAEAHAHNLNNRWGW